MNGLIFFLFLIFFVFPIMKNIAKSGSRPKSKYQSKSRYHDIAKRLQEEARRRVEHADHGVTKTQKHRQLHRNDDSNVFPEEHLEHVQARDRRDKAEYRRMEATIHGKNNRAMTKVGSKARTDWGSRGDNGMTSSKAITVFVLLLALVYFSIAAFFPDLLSG